VLGADTHDLDNRIGKNTNSITASNVVRVGFPDQFIKHGERHELLAVLDANGLLRTARKHRHAETTTRSESQLASVE
jgi:hypothetical protein